jgi:hypothetical protein
MRIGNRTDAMLAHEAAYGTSTPVGFERVGIGGCREVYFKDNVVYKVQTSFESYMRGFGNATEYTHARALRRQSDNGWLGRVYIPLVTGYSAGDSIIIAMERIQGTLGKWSNKDVKTPAQEEALHQLFMLGFGDMHAKNYMWLSGRKVGVSPVDMGSYRYRKNPSGPGRSDRRCIGGTKLAELLTQHDSWVWKNSLKDRYIAKSCPDGCGLVRWDA